MEHLSMAAAWLVESATPLTRPCGSSWSRVGYFLLDSASVHHWCSCVASGRWLTYLAHLCLHVPLPLLQY